MTSTEEPDERPADLETKSVPGEYARTEAGEDDDVDSGPSAEQDGQDQGETQDGDGETAQSAPDAQDWNGGSGQWNDGQPPPSAENVPPTS